MGGTSPRPNRKKPAQTTNEVAISAEAMIQHGKKLTEATRVAILVHGRGSTAHQILSLTDYLKLDDFAVLAPQAAGNTWYPYSFMAARQQNQPFLNQSLSQLHGVVQQAITQGKTSQQLYFFGFSQGACLVLEYTARHAAQYGGIAAFTGGLIGDKLDTNVYTGDFGQTPVLLAASHRDFHVPLARIEESEQILLSMNAKVHKIIAPDTDHTIREEEINWVNNHILA